MAVTSDVRDILDVFLISNLANISQNNLNLNFPPELQNFIDTQVINNLGTGSYRANFPADLRQIFSNFILDNFNTLNNTP